LAHRGGKGEKSITREKSLSWNEGPAKKSIIDFIAKVTQEGGQDFVPVSERIATFDNDGTLWCEYPIPVQLAFALDRVKALAPKHSEWKDKQPSRRGPQAGLDGREYERRLEDCLSCQEVNGPNPK